MRIVQGFLTLAVGCIVAGSAIAAQTVIPVRDAGGTAFGGGPSGSPWTATVGGGGNLVFYGQYSSSLANESGACVKPDRWSQCSCVATTTSR